MTASRRQTQPPRRDRPAHVVYIVGATDTGKTTWLLGQLKGSRRLVVWDVKGEFARKGLARPVWTLTALHEILKSSRAGWFAYQPRNMDDFALFCRLAFAWSRCDLVVEELSDVTSPGRAPLWWGIVIRRGRDQHLRVWATAQRPAEADKTIYGNRTLLHVHQLVRLKDRREIAAEMGIEQARVDGLRAFEWIAADRAGRITRGKTSG